MARLVGGGVGPVVVSGVSQRHVARAGAVQLAQHGQRIANRVPAFDADQRGNAPSAMDAHQVGSSGGHLEGVGIQLGQAVHHVDLLEHRLDRRRSGEVRGHVDRPELPADAAAPQPWDVSVERRQQAAGVAPQIQLVELIVEPLPQLPGQVVVPINQRHLAQQAASPIDERRSGRLPGAGARAGSRGGGARGGSDRGSRGSERR